MVVSIFAPSSAPVKSRGHLCTSRTRCTRAPNVLNYIEPTKLQKLFDICKFFRHYSSFSYIFSTFAPYFIELPSSHLSFMCRFLIYLPPVHSPPTFPASRPCFTLFVASALNAGRLPRAVLSSIARGWHPRNGSHRAASGLSGISISAQRSGHSFPHFR